MSDAPQEAWFFTKDGKQYGPVVFDELRFLASNGELHPRQDLVWTARLPEWGPAGGIDGLFEKVAAEAPPEVVVPTMTSAQIQQSGREESGQALMTKEMNWMGVARGPYFLGMVVLSVLMASPFYAAGLWQKLSVEVKGNEYILWAIPALLYFGMVALNVRRLQNVGMSGWWFLGTFVPFLNLWVNYRIFACPPGYRFHRKLDGAGVFLTVVYSLSLVATVVSAVLMLMLAAGAIGSPELQQKIREAQQKSREKIEAREEQYKQKVEGASP